MDLKELDKKLADHEKSLNQTIFSDAFLFARIATFFAVALVMGALPETLLGVVMLVVTYFVCEQLSVAVWTVLFHKKPAQ